MLTNRVITMFFIAFAPTVMALMLAGVLADATPLTSLDDSQAVAPMADRSTPWVAQDAPACRHSCKIECGPEDAELPGFTCPPDRVCCQPPAPPPMELCDGTCRSACAPNEYASLRGCSDSQLCCKPKAPPPPRALDDE